MQGKNVRTAKKVQTFSQRLHLTRKNRDLSQGELAKKLGLTGQAQVSRYENGKSLPDVAVLAKISEALQVDLHWLITGKSSPCIESLIERVKPYVYGHLSDVTLRIQKLERERRELYCRNAQGEAREGGIKDVEKLLAQHHAYYKAAYEALNELLDIQSHGDKDILISYDMLKADDEASPKR